MLSMFRRKTRNDGIEVDYDRELYLPIGADKVLWHKPVGSGKVVFAKQRLVIRTMPAGVSYLEYRAMHPGACFADAQVLDSLLAPYTDKKTNIRETGVESLLATFSGQIFFLGTAFEGRFNGQATELLAYLNWRTYQPALRYMCPAHHPINHTVNCCAMFIEQPLQIS